MPYIKARERAGLSPEPRAAAADSYVEAGSQLAIEWVRPGPGDQLSLIKLAGPYSGPMESKPLPSGSERYINPTRFEIPAEAWLSMGAPPAGIPPLSPPPRQPVMASSATAKLPPEVAALNHHYESCCLRAYPDPGPTGLPITIGWGSTFYRDGSAIQLGDVITQSEADELYDYNCREKFWNILQRTIPHWSEMSDKQRAALCSFAYNNGAYFYGDGEHNTIDRHLRERNWQAVPGALMLYRNPGDRTEVGLGRRRRAEGLVWLGKEPTQAISQAEREIHSPADCEAWEQTLIQQGAGATPPTPARPASEAERPAYDPTAPIDWQDMNARVSRYFTVGEVTQKDRRRIPRAGSQEEKNILQLARELDKVRDAWGSPIGVTSWYRPNSPIDINAEVGGVPNSQHISGRAADVYTMDGRDQEFERWLDTVAWKDRALGYGVAAGRGFTHVDLRPGQIRWPY